MTRNQISELLPIGNPIPDGRRYDPISAAIGIGGNLIGGLIGSNAASRAARLQAEAAQNAGQGVVDTTKAVRQDQLDAATRAGNRTVDAANLAKTDVNSTANQAAFNVTDAATGANKLLDPYASAGADASGTLQKGLVAGGDFNKTPTLADLQMDPGYAFREQQGELALQRTAAARGQVQGGGFAKELQGFGQANASQEYQNAFQRFQQSTQNRFSNLNTVAGRGVAAADTQGANMNRAAEFGGQITTDASKFGGQLTTGANQFAGSADINANDRTSAQAIAAAQAKGDYLTQAGNARAAGAVGSASALTTGITGAANTALWLKNPSAGYNRVQGPSGSPYAGNFPGGTYQGAGPQIPPR